MTDEERTAFAAAAKTIAETIRNNSGNYDRDSIAEEAGELSRLELISGANLDLPADVLRRVAENLAEPEDDSPTDPEERPSSRVSSDQEIDLDSLFTGLTDR